MTKENIHPRISSWAGKDCVVNVLQSTPQDFVPDTSFRDWPDESIEEKKYCELLPDELLAGVVRSLRSDMRVLTVLALAHTPAKSPPGVRDHLQSHDLSDKSIDRESIRKILKELSMHGIVDIEPGEKGPEFFISNSLSYYVGVAGHLAEFSRKYEVPLQDFIGADENATKDKDGQWDPSYTVTRIQILREIQKSRRENGSSGYHPITQSTLARDLGIDIQVARHHLDSLARAGIITNTSIQYRKSYREYEYKPKGDLQVIDNPRSIADWIRYYATTHSRETLTSDSAYEFIVGHNQFDEYTDEQSARLRSGIQQQMKRFGAEGYLTRTGPLSREQKSALSFAPRTGQIDMMRDINITLVKVAREDSRTEEEGLEIGRSIINSTQDISFLLEKHRTRARWSKSKSKRVPLGNDTLEMVE